MKIFVINLARSTERRASIEHQLKQFNLDYEIFEAVDGAQLSYAEIMRDTKPLNYAISCGEIGCALSHIGIYKKIVAQNIPEALILEDDALITSQTADTLTWLSSLNISKPTVTLLTETTHYISKKLHVTNDDSHSVCSVLEAACSHGYVVNYEAAKQLIDFLYPVWMVADKWQALREYSVCDVVAVIPPVITKTQHADKSTIGNNDAPAKWMEQKKDFMWSEIKKHRPFKVKLKRFLWASFVYPFLKISK
ncbi:glycosyltransferase family 25 protein [Enterobacteriaceae bacterium ML5]|nr:glycosyltransferase family 25 protein [Enterobacteriaceae bacterium ML5]